MKKLVICVTCIGAYSTVNYNWKLAKKIFGVEPLLFTNADPVRLFVENDFAIRENFSNVVSKLLCKEAYTLMGNKKIPLALNDPLTREIMMNSYDKICIAIFTHRDCAGSPDLHDREKKENMTNCLTVINDIFLKEFPEVIDKLELEAYFVNDGSNNIRHRLIHSTLPVINSSVEFKMKLC